MAAKPDDRVPPHARRHTKKGKSGSDTPKSAFAAELAKVL
jgi:hypothetical protein